MEHSLKCNALKCRRELKDRAVVTSCSHVFCCDCASRSGLDAQPERRGTCPACNNNLSNLHDAAFASLNPSEEYKANILSGMSPNVIMECAGRALSFWAYQTTQEIVYQKCYEKKLTDRYNELDMQMDKTVNEANREIVTLQSQLKDLTLQNDSIRRKHEELGQAFKDKSRKLLQTQELYDRVRRKAEIGSLRAAACDEVETQLQTNALSASHERGSSQGLFEQQTNYANQSPNQSFLEPGSLSPQGRGTPHFTSHAEPWTRQSANSHIGTRKPTLVTPSRRRGSSVSRISLPRIPGLMATRSAPLNGLARMHEHVPTEPTAGTGNHDLGTGISGTNVGHMYQVVGGNSTPTARAAQRETFTPSAFVRPNN